MKREPIKERLMFKEYENWIKVYEDELAIKEHTDTFWNTSEGFGQVIKWISKDKKEDDRR